MVSALRQRVLSVCSCFSYSKALSLLLCFPMRQSTFSFQSISSASPLPLPSHLSLILTFFSRTMHFEKTLPIKIHFCFVIRGIVSGFLLGVECTTFPHPPISHLSNRNLHAFVRKLKHAGWTRMQAIASYCIMDKEKQAPMN